MATRYGRWTHSLSIWGLEDTPLIRSDFMPEGKPLGTMDIYCKCNQRQGYPKFEVADAVQYLKNKITDKKILSLIDETFPIK